jgi:hypothetical protein
MMVAITAMTSLSAVETGSIATKNSGAGLKRLRYIMLPAMCPANVDGRAARNNPEYNLVLFLLFKYVNMRSPKAITTIKPATCKTGAR